MPKIRVSAIAAIGKNTRVLGDSVKNDLVWRIKEDMAHFKLLTMGHPVIMGRKTWDSIPPKFRPLAGRKNIVMTRDLTWEAPEVSAAHSIEQALELAKSYATSEVFIIGGAEMYKLALPHTDRLYLTLIESDAKGDVFFPEYENIFRKIIEPPKRSEEKGLKYEFVILEK